MSTGFDEIAYAFEMLGGGTPKFYRRMPDGKWEDYQSYIENPRYVVAHKFSYWNAEGADATRIVLALYSLITEAVIGYAIAHRLGTPPGCLWRSQVDRGRNPCGRPPVRDGFCAEHATRLEPCAAPAKDGTR